MKPDEFLNSIYLGDRARKAVVLDGWNGEVKIQMNLGTPITPNGRQITNHAC